jgi:hypothetical protein
MRNDNANDEGGMKNDCLSIIVQRFAFILSFFPVDSLPEAV